MRIFFIRIIMRNSIMMLAVVAAVLLTDTACLVSRHGPNCMCMHPLEFIIILLRVYQQLLFSFTFQCFRTACVKMVPNPSLLSTPPKNQPTTIYHSGLMGENISYACRFVLLRIQYLNSKMLCSKRCKSSEKRGTLLLIDVVH